MAYAKPDTKKAFADPGRGFQRQKPAKQLREGGRRPCGAGGSTHAARRGAPLALRSMSNRMSKRPRDSSAPLHGDDGNSRAAGGAALPSTPRGEQATFYYQQTAAAGAGKPEWSPAQRESLSAATDAEERRFLLELSAHKSRHADPKQPPIKALQDEGWCDTRDAAASARTAAVQKPAPAVWLDPPSLEDTLQLVLHPSTGGRPTLPLSTQAQGAEGSRIPEYVQKVFRGGPGCQEFMMGDAAAYVLTHRPEMQAAYGHVGLDVHHLLCSSDLCMYVCMHLYVGMYVCMHVCMYAYMYVCL